MDLVTVFVYVGILILSCSLALFFQRGFKVNGGVVVRAGTAPLLLILISVALSMLSAIRYDVGVDWQGYTMSYEVQRLMGYDRAIMDRWEVGYSWINRFYAGLNMSYHWMFFSVAFIGWSVFLRAVPVSLLFLTLFFVFTGELYFWSNNAVRQFVAAAFFMYSLNFVSKRNLLGFTAVILIGSLFHYSVLLTLPLYFILMRIPVSKVLLPGVVIVTFVLGQSSLYISILEFVESSLRGLVLWFGYGGYIERLNEISIPDKGLGFYWIVLTNLLIVTVTPYIPESKINIRVYLSAFFLGVVIFNLLYMSQLFGRISVYFLFLKPVMLAYFIVSTRNTIVWGSLKVILIVGYLAIYVAAMEGSSHQCCPYRWQLP